MLHDPLLIDDIGRPTWHHTKPLFDLPLAIELVALINQQPIRQATFFGKLQMAALAILTHPNNLSPSRNKVFIQVAKLATLHCSAGCIILWIEKYHHDFLATIAAKGHCGPIVPQQRKITGNISYFHRLTPCSSDLCTISHFPATDQKPNDFITPHSLASPKDSALVISRFKPILCLSATRCRA